MRLPIVEAIIMLVIVLCFIFFGFQIWKEFTSQKIELNKDEWICSKSEVSVQNIMIGGKLMPQAINKCVEYKLR
ncbi:hypothetical protein C2U65_10920 [Acinetobacter baumannii]|nr:hypothetical protein [Acinetobacter baumannii]RCI30083.1 hypothetical protein C2U66_15390 [Acinetobacter baumannii]RCI35562.1 hypothetical protein C2U65_10920 [Acinetobacter baumannii]